MPLYEFKCEKCSAQTEVNCKFSEKEEKTPTCCGNDMSSMVSSMQFELKGSGWTPRGVDYLT